MILSHERVQIHARENLCSYATNPPHFRVRELLLCDSLITRAGDGCWPRYQAKSLACPGCEFNTFSCIYFADGADARQLLSKSYNEIQIVPCDVTSDASVKSAKEFVIKNLKGDQGKESGCLFPQVYYLV